MARPLAVAGFNAGARCQVMINKMAGRFAPVSANDPYTGGNPAINTEPLFQNWLRGKYREVMVGTNRGAIFALVNEKFSEIDTPDSYEKRIIPLVQAMPDADALPYLYNHLPVNLEMRIRIANPATIQAFFTELRNKWHESGGRRAQAPVVMQPQSNISLEKLADIAIRLGYTGDITNPVAIHAFIESDLTRNYGRGQTQHIRKDHFGTRQDKKVNATKSSNRSSRHCSKCGKMGHTKNKCPRGKRTKKVNNTFIDDPEDSRSEEETDEETEEEVSEEEEDEENFEPQNCFRAKKKLVNVGFR
jgi:transcription elongation factor Elf1